MSDVEVVRLGWSIRLHHASVDLAELLDLVGLAEVLPREPDGSPPSGAAVSPR